MKHANIYKNLSPQTEKNIFDHDILHVLPKRDQLGRRILVIELGSEFIVDLVIRRWFLIEFL